MSGRVRRRNRSSTVRGTGPIPEPIPPKEEIPVSKGVLTPPGRYRALRIALGDNAGTLILTATAAVIALLAVIYLSDLTELARGFAAYSSETSAPIVKK